MIFRKGIVHGFDEKLAIFLPFTLWKIGQQNVFNDIIECENASLDYKDNKLKNWDFTRDVKKLAIFQSFFVRQNWTAEYVSRVRVRLKQNNFKKIEKQEFVQNV